MKTPQEIVAYYNTHKTEDFFGFIAEVLLSYLPFDLVKPFLKDTATAESWGQPKELTEESIKATMAEYMKFAWGKVEDHRGISATRSVEKMASWLWLLDDDAMVAFCRNDNNYAYYGAPILQAISEKYGFPVPLDESVHRMMAGEPCTPDCEGCNG